MQQTKCSFQAVDHDGAYDVLACYIIALYESICEFSLVCFAPYTYLSSFVVYTPLHSRAPCTIPSMDTFLCQRWKEQLFVLHWQQFSLVYKFVWHAMMYHTFICSEELFNEWSLCHPQETKPTQQIRTNNGNHRWAFYALNFSLVFWIGCLLSSDV